jgi:hypothetical protein
MDLRPNDRRAKTAIILIWAVLGFDILLTASNFLQWRTYREIRRGAALDLETIHAGDHRQAVIATLYVFVYLVSVATFLRWFRRAFYNLGQLDRNAEFRDVDTIWPWFVPVVNLFRPFQVMRELHVRTADYLRSKGIQAQASANALTAWWALWILKIASGQVSVWLSVRADSVEKLETASGFATGSAIVSIPLALMAILVIQNYREMARAIETAN